MTAYLVAMDCFDDARACASQALDAVRDGDAPVLAAFVLQHIAAIAALEGGGKPEQAAMVLGFVDARLQLLGAHRDYTERQERDRIVSALRTVLGERLESLMELGAKWDEAAAVSACFRSDLISGAA